MGRLGVFLLGGAIVILLGGMGIKPAMDGLYNVMNSTGMANLTMTESVAWRFMPYIIMLVLFGILIAYLTGKIGGHHDEGGEE